MNVLFLCTANIQRSRTAEDLFSMRYLKHSFRSAGLSQRECARNSSTLCTEELLSWADQIYVFEQLHIERIQEHTGQRYMHKIQCLNIDDVYQYMQPELVEKLELLNLPFE